MPSSQAVEAASLRSIKQLMQQNVPLVSFGRRLNERQVEAVDSEDVLPWGGGHAVSGMQSITTAASSTDCVPADVGLLPCCRPPASEGLVEQKQDAMHGITSESIWSKRSQCKHEQLKQYFSRDKSGCLRLLLAIPMSARGHVSGTAQGGGAFQACVSF